MRGVYTGVTELMVAIEIDGDSHAQPADYERQRTARLNQLGIEVIRYANRDMLTNLVASMRTCQDE